jgi:glycosyltransferase involved in cell wall biosynthesis
MLSLSIIVPIYNVEKYVHSCLESIFRQGMTDETFEVILVNDGTQDHSMEMISDIIKAHLNIKVIEQQNQGLSNARNNGMQEATGEYVIFVDSDDMLIENSLYPLLNKTIESKADLLIADFCEIDDNGLYNGYQQIDLNAIMNATEKTGEESFLIDLSPYDCHVWHNIYRRKFLLDNNIKFTPNIIYEDIPFTHECYIKAKKCLRIKCPMYLYRKGHTQSITSYFTKKSGLDYVTAIAKTWELTYIKGLSPKVIFKLKENVFTCFSFMIYCITHNIPNPNDKIDIITHFKQIAPNIRFRNGIKQRIVNYMIWEMPSLYLYLRDLYACYFEESIWKLKKQYT